MGYPTLDSFLAFKDNVPPVHSHIAITDCLKSEGNFLIHHFVINQLKGNRPVLLVGLAQIFNHYFLIGRKLGVNLQTYKQSGKLCFLDGLTHLNEYTANTPYPPSKAPTAPTDTLDYQKKDRHSLESYYRIIEKYMNTGTLLILDDISVLVYNGFNMNDICLFIRKLKSLIEKKDGTLVTLMHADEEVSDEHEQDNFIKSVIYDSDIVLQVMPLNSGLSRDIHGEIDIVYGPKYKGDYQLIAQSLHYKILDNNVHFFPKGVSQGVF